MLHYTAMHTIHYTTAHTTLFKCILSWGHSTNISLAVNILSKAVSSESTQHHTSTHTHTHTHNDRLYLRFLCWLRPRLHSDEINPSEAARLRCNEAVGWTLALGRTRAPIIHQASTGSYLDRNQRKPKCLALTFVPSPNTASVAERMELSLVQACWKDWGAKNTVIYEETLSRSFLLVLCFLAEEKRKEGAWREWGRLLSSYFMYS